MKRLRLSAPTLKRPRPSNGGLSSRIDSTIASPELLLELEVSLWAVDVLDEELVLTVELELLDWLDGSEMLEAELALLWLESDEGDELLLDDVSDATVELLLELVSDAAVELELLRLLEVSEPNVLLDDDDVSLWAVLLELLLLRLDSSDWLDGDEGELLLVSEATVELEELWLLALEGELLEVSLANVLEELLFEDALESEDEDVSLASVDELELFEELLLVREATVELEDEFELEELEEDSSSPPPKSS